MLRALATLIGCAAILLVRADAQVRPIYDTGAAGLVQLLQRLQTTASVLHTGAHPDDEDSAFLARAARATMRALRIFRSTAVRAARTSSGRNCSTRSG